MHDSFVKEEDWRRSKVHSSLIFVLFFVLRGVIFFHSQELSTGVK